MTRLTLALLVLLASGAAEAACIYPRAPDHVPDGKTATEEEMVAAHKLVQLFNEDIVAYNACLDLEIAAHVQSGAFDENRLNELRAMQDKKHNAAIDEVESVAGEFNEQLRIYNAREKQD